VCWNPALGCLPEEAFNTLRRIRYNTSTTTKTCTRTASLPVKRELLLEARWFRLDWHILPQRLRISSWLHSTERITAAGMRGFSLTYLQDTNEDLRFFDTSVLLVLVSCSRDVDRAEVEQLSDEARFGLCDVLHLVERHRVP
jgi:hypothetical protein